MDDELHHLGTIKGQEALEMLDQGDVLIDGVISAVGVRRIILTKSVGKAWERFTDEKHRGIIKKSFRQ